MINHAVQPFSMSNYLFLFPLSLCVHYMRAYCAAVGIGTNIRSSFIPLEILNQRFCRTFILDDIESG